MIARLQAWGAAALTAAIAVLAAFGWGWLKGARGARRNAEAKVDAIEHRARAAERAVDEAQVRAEVESDVLHTPTSTVASMAGADADSVVGRLRDEWSRD